LARAVFALVRIPNLLPPSKRVLTATGVHLWVASPSDEEAQLSPFAFSPQSVLLVASSNFRASVVPAPARCGGPNDPPALAGAAAALSAIAAAGRKLKIIKALIITVLSSS
jgi:hypothetical protein